MKLYINIILIGILQFLYYDGVYSKQIFPLENDGDIDSIANPVKAHERPILRRTKRHVHYGHHSVPVLRSFYHGLKKEIDHCDRDEVFVPSAKGCFKLLTQGPCDVHEMVLMHHESEEGFCAPRLCNPDRVFVLTTQSCHDPHEPGLCPPGRRLFTSAYGTPVCGCPYGTFAHNDGIHEDVCVPALGDHTECNKGEVYWFENFQEKAKCLPDPCQGKNLEKEQSEHPYVHSLFDGSCHQLGNDHPECPENTHYSLSLDHLRGICLPLERAGYVLVEDHVHKTFIEKFGKCVPKVRHFHSSRFDDNSLIHSHPETSPVPSTNSGVLLPRTNTSTGVGSIVIEASSGRNGGKPLTIVADDSPQTSEFIHSVIDRRAQRGDADIFIISAQPYSFPRLMLDNTSGLEQFLSKKLRKLLRRNKRSLSSVTAFQSALSPCSPGQATNMNAKCRHQIAPDSSRVKRHSPFANPHPPCSNGYTVGNTCAQSSNSRPVNNPFG